MKFLVDRCAGRRLAEWLRVEGHDVVEATEQGPDPGDLALLASATAAGRVLVTIDTDFGYLVFVAGAPHSGLVRLPDVPAAERIALMRALLERHAADLEAGAIATVGRATIRIAKP